MEFSNVIRSGPDQLINEKGCVKGLVSLLASYRKPVIITGPNAFQAFSDYFGEVPYEVVYYDRSASLENIAQLADQVIGADVLVAIGGGKLLDTAKSVADRNQQTLFVIPTNLATCAAYSALSVLYDAQHRYSQTDYHQKNSQLLLIDTDFLVHSPKAYFVAGIGDTLAKWYEAEAVFRNGIAPATAFEQVGLLTSKLIKEILLEHALTAVHDLETGKNTTSFSRTAEAILGVAGTVGGFAGDKGRTSGAHAIHNALTNFHAAAPILHGEKVAYGILIQLLTTNEEAEVRRLLPFYKKLGLPHKLEQLHLRNSDPVKEKIAAYAVLPTDSYRLAVPTINRAQVKAALSQLETIQ